MKTCKHCGASNQFKARVIRGAVVELLADGSWNIKQESQKFSIEPAQCLACGAKLNGMEDIIESMVECPDCKTQHDPATMIDGLCPTCYAKKQRPDILAMSQEDMIRRLIELERMAKADKVAVKEEKVAEAVAKVEEKKEAAADTTKKTTRKSKAKDKDKEESAPAPTDPLSDIENQMKQTVDTPPENIDPSEQEEVPEAVHQEDAIAQDSVETNTPPVAPPEMDETPF